jgi:hypothetical protein
MLEDEVPHLVGVGHDAIKPHCVTLSVSILESRFQGSLGAVLRLHPQGISLCRLLVPTLREHPRSFLPVQLENQHAQRG